MQICLFTLTSKVARYTNTDTLTDRHQSIAVVTAAAAAAAGQRHQAGTCSTGRAVEGSAEVKVVSLGGFGFGLILGSSLGFGLNWTFVVLLGNQRDRVH